MAERDPRQITDTYANAYAGEYVRVTEEIQRLQARIKELRLQQRTSQKQLYDYMIRTGRQKITVTTTTTHNLTPAKLKMGGGKQRIKPKEKKEKAIRLLMESGVPDPNGLWKEINTRPDEKKS